ncbi:SH2 domain-containing protein 6 isoform 2-T2 [Sarcophilus harrisii]
MRGQTRSGPGALAGGRGAGSGAGCPDPGPSAARRDANLGHNGVPVSPDPASAEKVGPGPGESLAPQLPLMDKTGGNGTPSQPPLPPPRAPGKPPRGAARGVSPSWREDACLPASPGSAGLLSQWDAEEEEDGEGEYELPPCESLAAHTAPFPVEKSELYLDRSVTAGPPKPEPRPSRDPAEEEDSEDAIYLEPSLVSPLKQDLGPQAPSTPAVIPRPTMVPRPAYKALSGPQEAWSGSGDIAYNELRSSLLMCLLLWPQPHRVIFFQWGGVHSRGNPLQRRDAKKKNEIIAVNQLIARGQWDPLCCVCAQKAGLLTQPWYSAHCDRQTVENTLLLLRKAQLRSPRTEALHPGCVLPRPRLPHPHPVARSPGTVRTGPGEQELRQALPHRGFPGPAFLPAPPAPGEQMRWRSAARPPPLPHQGLTPGGAKGQERGVSRAQHIGGA